MAAAYAEAVVGIHNARVGLLSIGEEDAKGTTTLESKTNFIGGAKEGTTLIATATPVHRGRRTQVWQTRLETDDGKLVAVVTQTQMVL